MRKINLDLTQLLILAAGVMVAVLVGMVLPVAATLLGDSVGRLAAVPALFLLGAIFVFNKRLLLLLILLLRASGDVVLESTRLGAAGSGGAGLGGAINALIILIALLFFIEKPRLLPRKAAVAWLIFLAWEAVCVVVSPNAAAGLKTALSLCSCFAVFVCAFYVVRTEDDFRFMVRIMIGSSIIPAIYGLVSVVMAGGVSGGFRLQSTFTHPNILAFYLTLIISLGLYVLKSPTFKLSQLQRFAFTGYLGVLMVLLLLTQTRSAWAAVLVLFVLYGLFFERRYLIYLLVLCCLSLLIPSVQQRLLDLDGGGTVVGTYAKLNSFAWRVLLWESALNWMSSSRYLTGYGVEAFGYYVKVFFPLSGNIEWMAHNVYVQLFFDTGVIGLVTYLALFYQAFRALLLLYPKDRLGGGILMCALVEYLVVSASDNMLSYLAFNWYFWMAMGMGWSLHLHGKAAGKEKAVQAVRVSVASGA
ncbi:O-antigen ligase family protein [Herbaspirillum huttiense]|uniref:O-antigen ligase family protein n=1 Tax=Herbaspirillum huttiense TaxID=863372 RepID=UPI001065845B|nr:O-antigen ligase family protein [Herbaspirillum huttiense]QBP75355.1 O-antigen ligase family protein [Herbaspirillum huttiense]